MTGIVRVYFPQRGFGFLHPLTGIGPDAPQVFFHASAIRGARRGEPLAIPKGAEVSFKLVRGERGPQAADVRLKELSGSVLREKP